MQESTKQPQYNLDYPSLFKNGGSVDLTNKRACVEVLSGSEILPNGRRAVFNVWRIYTQLRLHNGSYAQPSNLREFKDKNEAVSYLGRIVKQSTPAK